jgi:hypothetical protein
MKTDEMWEAHYHAQAAANSLLVAHTIRAEVGRMSKLYTDEALRHAQKFAEALGFDLVKREPAKEPAEEAA